ncbi:leucine-rich repeat-containing 40 [Brachionus plicatilis]|uniref:Leucine-rich repeat-containing 40 n=1 Tax=Brachionus plicatilis TaxID=10195 RepID=A0A3M7SS20_BRAPC|nr:leucine-rich repeat-containing 40 [Brachionus plicatilis]
MNGYSSKGGPSSSKNRPNNTDTKNSEKERIHFHRSETYIVEKSNCQTKKENNNSKTDQLECEKKASKPISSIALIKQQKRAEMKKVNDRLNANAASGNVKSIEVSIKSAKNNGQLNLSNLNLIEVPQAVWDINIDNETHENNKFDVSFENNQSKWWNQVELTKFIIASNKLKIIPQDIQKLSNLIFLDIHDNQIEWIDEALATVSQLKNFNCSHNQLTQLPNGLCTLKYLVELNASHNRLGELPQNFGHLDDLENLNLSNNRLNSIPKSFRWLHKIRKINLAVNSLKTNLSEIFFSTNLTLIDLSENQIETLPEELNELANLEQFYAKKNKITIFPTFYKCSKLKDLDLSFNQIKEIDDKTFNNLISLVNFYIRDNKLCSLSQSIKNLKNLERIDLSNNDLSALPNELAELEYVKQLLISGNPLRTIRRDIINRGTDAILKHLKNQIKVTENQESQNSEEMMLKSENIIKSSKIFDLSYKKISIITPSIINYCKQSTASVLNVMKNSLSDLPEEIGELNNQLNEVNASFNLFTLMPKSILKLTNLSYLDFRGNRISDLPIEFNQLKSLRELIISDNKFQIIPDCVYQLPILENLFANNNQIKYIDGVKIVEMKCLALLNLQNNDIANVPPILGKAIQIKSLQLEGNPFKIPRSQILAKGTAEILNYLSGRLTEN